MESALADALKIQVSRISGETELEEFPGLVIALRATDRYVRQYRFRTNPGGTGIAATVLIAEFDSDAVLDLLRERNLPIWPMDRPRILVWYEYVTQHGTVLMTASDPEAHDWQRSARNRGLPLLVPLLDLTDRKFAGTGAVLGGFRRDLTQASSRYRPELIVFARSEPLPFERQRVTLELAEGQLVQEKLVFDVSSQENIAREVVDRIADRLSDQFAITRDKTHVLRIDISGVESLEDYLAVMEHVAQFELIDRVEVSTVDAKSIELIIYTPMTERQLSTLLTQNGPLQSREQMREDSSLAFAWGDSE